MRAAALQEPRPQVGMGRHRGIGYELVLNPVLPPLGAQEAERALPAFLQQREGEAKAAGEKRIEEINEKVLAKIPLSSAERAAWRQWMGLWSQPSSSSGGKSWKKRKRRKKKVPKTHSSSSLRRGVGDQGTMIEYAEDELKEIAGYSGLWETAPSMNGLGMFIKEKVIREEEIILRSGMPALCLYRGRRCWFDWREYRHRYVWRLGYTPWRTGMLLTYTYGQVCYEEWVEQTWSGTPSDKTVQELISLLFDVPPDCEFQLGRPNAVLRRIYRMIMLGPLIDDDDEELGADDDLASGKVQRRKWRRWKMTHFAS